MEEKTAALPAVNHTLLAKVEALEAENARLRADFANFRAVTAARKSQTNAKLFTVATVENNAKIMQFYCGIKPTVFEILFKHLAPYFADTKKMPKKLRLLLLLRSVHRNTRLLELQFLTGTLFRIF